MTELILYTNPMSRGRIARWMLEEVGVPYEARVLDYGLMKAPDYLAINPMGKVPALVHDGAVVTEVVAICAYLAAAFPTAGLAPAAGSADGAAYFRWLFFAAGPLEAAITNKSCGFELPPGRERMAGYGSYAAVMDALEGAVSAAPYVAGEAFSAADVIVGGQISFGLMFKTVEPRPAFLAYWERLKDRPALARANGIDDALIAAAKAG